MLFCYMAHLNELAVSMHRQRGIFALLLGSGLSRAANVPTGWDVTLDLIKQLAVASGSEAEDLEAWYKNTYGKEPDYSELLEEIAATEAERRGVLESYFEPNQEDREQGFKLPTAAHKAIAKLVAKGYVHVILTTNFDRLLEQALLEEGIQAVVVSSSDAITGAPPYIHPPVTIVKLHGDYKDTRIKNSSAELAQYDDALNSYLDRILDEFGLIVAGWSGDWDAALRSAISRMKNRRYSLYWLAYSSPSAAAQKLIDFRKGRVVSGLSADGFFEGLLAKVEALEEAAWLPPQSPELLIAEVKRYLAEPERYGIRLEDLVFDEARELAKVMQSDNEACPWALYPERVDECRRCVEYLEFRSERLTRVLSTIVRYDKAEVWSTVVSRAVGLLAKRPIPGHSNELGTKLRLYPLTLIMTSLCVISAQEGRTGAIQTIFGLTYQNWNDERPFMWALLDVNDAGPIINAAIGGNVYYPAAIRASRVLPGWLQPLLISERPFYDQGEFILSLASMQIGRVQGSPYWTPIGGRYMHYQVGGTSVEKLVKSRPTWFNRLFPDFLEMAQAFDEITGNSGRGRSANSIRLVPFLN